MQYPLIPRVTYTNLGVHFSTLDEMLDREIPAAKARLGREVPHFIGGKEDRDGPPYTIVSPIDRTLTLAICHESAHRRDDGCVAGRAIVRRLEGVQPDRKERLRSALPGAHA